MGDLNHILVFKTNISTGLQKEKVRELLDANQLIEDWHVDMEDVDRVLRIVSYRLCANEINRLMQQAGFECCELE